MNDRGIPTWDDVRRLADELELKIHLAGMDARDSWKALQPKLIELERTIHREGTRAGQVISDQLSALGKALEELRAKIAGKAEAPH